MNRKQLILLVIVGLLLGGLAMVFRSSRNREFQNRDVGVGQKLLADFPTENVAAVAIRSGDSEVNLVKKDVWVVQERSGYPASFTQISDLVRKLWELKPAQSEEVGQSQWGRLELLPPGTKDAGTNAATLIELKDKDGKALGAVLLGRKQMRDSGGQFGGYPVGRWIAIPSKTDTVYVTSETFTEFESKPESWLNKDNFLKVEKLKSISLTGTNDAQTWSLARPSEAGDWVLTDPRPGEQADKGKTSSLNWALSSPTFNDVLPKDAEAVKDAFASASTLRIGTFDGFDYVVKVAPADGDDFWLTVEVSADLPKEREVPADEKPEDKEARDKAWKEQQDKLREKLKKEQALNGWVYKVARWSVDSLLKDRSQWMADAKNPDDSAATGGGAAPAFPAPVPPLLGAGDAPEEDVPPLDPEPIAEPVSPEP